jgi:uncharacterized protein (TIGR02145 family)/uncharacterized repeat protein (TIGR02543 family)
MRLRILSITVVIFTLLTSFFFCTNVINPIEKYENVSAALKANRFLWKIGVPDSFSVHLFAPNLVDSIVIDFGENGQDTAFIRPSDPNHPTDSFSVAHTYSIAGFKPIWARAYLKNGEIEQSDTLSINVGAQPNAPLGITMTDTPKIGQMFYIPASATGSDTLRYQWFKNGSAVVGGYAANLLLQSLSINDTGAYFCVVTNAWGQDTTGIYTLAFTSPQNHAPKFGLYQSSRTVKVNQALAITIAATDPDHNAITYSLLNESGFAPTEIVKTLPPDSIRIVFTPAVTGTRELKIAASDGTLSDTAIISVQVDPANVNSKPVFAAFDSTLTDTINKALVVTLQATDADLTPLTFRLLDSASFAAGEINASTATYSMTVTFTPKTSGARLIRVSVSDGSLMDTARIHIAVVDRDSVAPVIRLVNQKLDSSSTNTSYAVIECIVTDNKAIDSVVISSGGVVFPIKNNNDSSYNAEVNGLQAGVFTTIVIRAIDKAGNSTSRTVHIKYDPTMVDRQKPQIILLAPISPTATASATVIAKIKDASNVAEVKINATAVTSTDSLYTRQIVLVSGDNTITVYAKDASTNANDTTATYTIRYEPTAADTTGPKIRLNTPADNTTLTTSPATVKVVVTDPSSVASVTINGTTATSTDSVYSGSIILSEGNNAIQVTAQDNGYNHKTSSATYNLKLDSPPAAVTVTAPSGATANGMTISWSTSSASDFVAYKLYYATTSGVNEQSTLATTITTRTLPSYTISTGLTPNTTYYFKVYVCDNTSSIASNEVSAPTLPTAPTITTPPASSAKCVGEAVTFSVVAGGVSPFHYQWKRGSTNVGTDQASYPIPTIAAGDAGSYTCVVSNAGGSITTEAAILTVNTLSTAPTGASANPTSVSSGVSSTLTATIGTLGTNAVLKWYSQSCGGTEVGIGQSITVTPTATTTYYVRAEGTCNNTGCASTTVTFNPTYTVTFDGQGATIPPTPTTKSVIVPATRINALPTQPAKTGYVFDSWYTLTGGVQTPFTAETPVTASVTVNAKWIIKDADGNVYTEVTIGAQTWMVENLKTTKLNDGTPIGNGADDHSLWQANTQPVYGWANLEFKTIYGAWYNWRAVNTGKLAPEGWRVPTATDWDALATYLGGASVAGGKLKEVGTVHWQPTNDYATDEKGFKALPGGLTFGGSSEGGYVGNWFSSTASILRYIYYNSAELSTTTINEYWGFSVRLIRDY